jgi:hypothetical protein
MTVHSTRVNVLSIDMAAEDFVIELDEKILGGADSRVNGHGRRRTRSACGANHESPVIAFRIERASLRARQPDVHSP